MKKMYFDNNILSYWIDGDGNKIEISNMSNLYIENCIRGIIEAQDCSENGYSNSSIPFTKAWVDEYGEKYLQSFNAELTIRKRIYEKDFPNISIKKICENCAELNCTHMINLYYSCNRWKLNIFKVFEHCEDYISMEIVKRAGCYINGVLFLLN